MFVFLNVFQGLHRLFSSVILRGPLFRTLFVRDVPVLIESSGQSLQFETTGASSWFFDFQWAGLIQLCLIPRIAIATDLLDVKHFLLLPQERVNPAYPWSFGLLVINLHVSLREVHRSLMLLNLMIQELFEHSFYFQHSEYWLNGYDFVHIGFIMRQFLLV